MTGLDLRSTGSGDVRCRPSPEPAVFDCTLGRITQALNPTTEADPVGVLASLVSGVSAMVGRAAGVEIADSSHPLLVWSLLCGPTSRGRKGTAGDVARRVLSAVDPPFWRENVVSGLSSAEGLIALVQDDDEGFALEGEEFAPGSKKKDPADKRVLVVENEYAAVLARCRREGNALAQTLREAWDGRDLRVQTKNPLVASEPHIAIIGHVSPEEFRARTCQHDLAGGSYNRFLLLYVERSKRLPDGGGAPPELVNRLSADLRRRLQRAGMPHRLVRGPATRARWRDLYDEFCELEEDEQVASWVARAVPYTLRLAGLYALVDGSSVIESPHLEAAAALVRYALESARYVIDAGSASADVEQLARIIRSAGAEGVTKAVLTKKFSGRRTAAQLDPLLDTLTSLDPYDEVVERTGGRPVTRYVYRAA